MSNKEPLILVTNDDGVHSEGLKALFEAMQEIGEAVIIAPDREQSASSHSLTLHRPIKVNQIEDNIYTVDGTPTDCVTVGVNKILNKKPSLIASGINKGGNLGDDITYSGTVSAAIEGTTLGYFSFAISIAGESPFYFETASKLAKELALVILNKGLPKETLLNVNVPNEKNDAIKGMKFTRQGRRVYDNAILETFDPWGKKHYWIGGGTPVWAREDNTDSHAIESNCISITPIHLDLTNYEALKCLKKEWDGLF